MARRTTGEEAELFERAVQGLSKNAHAQKFDDKKSDGLHRLRSITGKKRTGEKRQQPNDIIQIDLHGMTRNEAIAYLKAELIRLRGKSQWVRVITGQGHNSKGLAVLKEAIPQWLTGAGKAYVLETAPAAPSEGGAGAILVKPR